MKNFILQIGRAIIAITMLMLLIMISVVSYEYLNVKLSAPYNADKMTLNYEITGSGAKNIILIHGLVGSKNYWKRGLDSITRTHKLFLVDLLGFGDSPKPQSNYNLKTQVEAMEKIIVKEELNNGQTLIVGHSLGSIITLALFAKHPKWFGGAVVIGLPVFSGKAQFEEEMEGYSYFDQLAVSRLGKIFCMLRPLYMNKLFKPVTIPDNVFADAKKHTWQSYYYSLNEIVLKTDLYALTKNIKNKRVLFIHGEKDKTAPFRNAKKLAESFSKAKFISVKDGNHNLFLTNPQMVWNLIDEFFNDSLFNENLRTGKTITSNTIPNKTTISI